MDSQHDDAPDAGVRTLRIIVGAMIAGTLLLTGVALTIGPVGETDESVSRTLVIILLVMAGGSCVAYFVLRNAIISQLRNRIRNEPSETNTTPTVVQQFHNYTIITAAMAEGYGLFGGVVLLLTGFMPIVVVPVACVFLLVLCMPTRDKLNRFIEEFRTPPR